MGSGFRGLGFAGHGLGSDIRVEGSSHQEEEDQGQRPLSKEERPDNLSLHVAP